MTTRLAIALTLAHLIVASTSCTGSDPAATAGADAGPDGADASPTGCLEVTDDVRADAVWSRLEGSTDGPDVCVRKDVTVLGGAQLTLGPGVRVAFDPGTTLAVARAAGAALTADGDPSATIELRGATPGAGSWGGVVIRSDDPRNRLVHVAIRGAGGGAVVADDTLGRVSAALVLDAEPGAPARAALRDLTVEDSAGWGLVVEGISEATELTRARFARNAAGALVLSPPNVYRVDATTAFEANGFDGVAITGTPNLELAAGVTWRALAGDARYLVREPIEVLSDLTIEAGARFVFGAGTGLTFSQNVSDTRAVVVVDGTPERPVTFTGEQASPGFWKGIEIQTGHAANVLRHVDVGFATDAVKLRRNGAFPPAALSIVGASLHDNAPCALTNTSVDDTLTTTDVSYARNAADACGP